jgi:hypothetical protein
MACHSQPEGCDLTPPKVYIYPGTQVTDNGRSSSRLLEAHDQISAGAEARLGRPERVHHVLRLHGHFERARFDRSSVQAAAGRWFRFGAELRY